MARTLVARSWQGTARADHPAASLKRTIRVADSEAPRIGQCGWKTARSAQPAHPDLAGGLRRLVVELTVSIRGRPRSVFGRAPGQAASAAAVGLQFQGRSSLRREAGWSLIRRRTSASHACGSRPLSLAVAIKV